jgi:3-hydroxybutyryl-CoA dehydrogenase
MIPSGKLESLSRRFAEVEQLLCDPKTLSDPQALTTLNRERTQLLPVVESFGKWTHLTKQIADDREALTDPELGPLAEQELPELQLDRACAPGTILATNTSSISITAIAAATQRPERVIGMHFMNPVPLMKLVEVIRGQETSDETCAAVVACAEALGKVPVLAQDYPGFVSNRVLMPMINEAVYCLMEGVATREGIDTVMKLGMNHPMGPLTLADLIGLDVCLDILEVLHAGFGDPKYRPCPLLRRMVAAGRLGRKAGKGFYEYKGN